MKWNKIFVDENYPKNYAIWRKTIWRKQNEMTVHENKAK